MRKKHFLFYFVMFALSIPLNSATYDAKINGIYYKFDYANNIAAVVRAFDDCGNFNGYVCYPDSVVFIPNKVTYDGQEFTVSQLNGCCFWHSDMKRVILPNTIRTIEGLAFANSNIENCVIPLGVQSIGNHIVYNCNRLKYIEVGEDVITMYNVGSFKNNRFYYNRAVKWNAINCSDYNVKRTKYISQLDGYIYEGYTPFYYARDEYTYEAYNEGYKRIEKYELQDSSKLMRNFITTFTFGQKVEHIPAYLCYQLQKLTSITIPKSVTSIGEQAFGECSSIVSVEIEAVIPPSGNGGLNKNATIYVPCESYEAYKSSKDWAQYDIQKSQYSYDSQSTSTIVTIGCDSKDIDSVGIQDGETILGNKFEYIGLEPDSEYENVPFLTKTKEGITDTIKISFSTFALKLTTLTSKAVSANTAILLAETNMSDAETSCGFEWKRNDAPENMAATQVLCPVANGLMAGRLKGLKDDVYYKYRAFYKSAAGNYYYGDWQYIFTGDVTVEFDPILYTYAAQFVSEHEATLKGYALAGSEDFTEQGFEYWAESRSSNSSARRTPQYEIGEKHTVKGSGISMRITLENLDEGTVYKYRTYAKVGNQTIYGSEMSFITEGEYIANGLDDVVNDNQDNRSPRATKVFENGQLFILRPDNTRYNLQGMEVK